jgi:hypothetical protein
MGGYRTGTFQKRIIYDRNKQKKRYRVGYRTGTEHQRIQREENRHDIGQQESRRLYIKE